MLVIQTTGAAGGANRKDKSTPAWNIIMSVRNILNQSQLSVFHAAQIFLNSERK